MNGQKETPGTSGTGERLCVVMPVYNEELAIGSVLRQWHATLTALDIDFEIRVWNDGSRDGSLDAMHATAKELGNRVVVCDKPNEGHGPTILRGYRDAADAGFDWIFQIDSDNEMGSERFVHLWALRHEHDFLVGRRDGRRQAWPRKIVSWVSRFCVRVFYGKSIWDVNSPYRLMRVSAFEKLFASLPSDTFAPNVILSGLAARNALRIKELPVPQHDRTTGEVSIKQWKLLKAAARSFGQTIRASLHSPRGCALFLLLALISTVLKFHASTKGWNYDFESYQIVADIVQTDGNVYMQTYRYNYGPIWFWILGALRNLRDNGFRYGIIALLGLADIGLGAILWKRRFYFATLLFFLSNISIHITGFHNQFDNLAVLTAFSALLLMDCKSETCDRGNGAYWAGVSLLGISIVLKHVFVFMPFWMLFRRESWKRRLFSCLIPLTLFGLSLLAYAEIPDLLENPHFTEALDRFAVHRQECGWIPSCRQFLVDIRNIDSPAIGIIKNVLRYRSQDNGQFYRWVLGANLVKIIPNTLFFFGIMVCLGWIVRERTFFEAGVIYTLGMFVFSPAIAMQYYAIPCLAAAVYWWPFGLLYHVVVGLLFLLKNGELMTRTLPILTGTSLLFGCLIVALRQEIASGLRKMADFLSSQRHCVSG